MPQEPKKRHSRARQGKRRAAIKLSIRNTVLCFNCQSPVLPHTICKKCGFYKGREVIDVTKKKKAKEKKAKEAEKNTA
ncbi:MAG: 50S ribosomal protein L32 [Patescibacteria group bacterium]|nr:50S ribosomal protein L32 [Patescibacteria group bacterium]